jgi:hypothetical protein
MLIKYILKVTVGKSLMKSGIGFAHDETSTEGKGA